MVLCYLILTWGWLSRYDRGLLLGLTSSAFLICIGSTLLSKVRIQVAQLKRSSFEGRFFCCVLGQRGWWRTKCACSIWLQCIPSQVVNCCATWFSLEGGWADMMFSSWRWVKWAKWVRWVKWVPKVKCRCCCRTPLQKHLTHLTHKLLHLSQTALISLYKNSPCEWTRRDYCVNLEVITNNVICMVWPSIGSFISCYWVVWDIDC